MLRMLLGAAVLVALSTGVARAQITDSLPGSAGYDNRFYFPGVPLVRERDPEDAGREHEIEQRYQQTLRTRIPDKKVPNDPWRNIRTLPATPAVDRHKPQ
jgi:hypothetical protein